MHKGFKKLTAGVAALTFMVLGAGTCFAYPYIENMLSPKTQVLLAIKEAGNDIQEQWQDMRQQTEHFLTSETNFQGNANFDKLLLNGTDYLKWTDYSIGAFGVCFNADKRMLTGTVGLKNEAGTKNREAEINLDTSKLALTEKNKEAVAAQKFYRLKELADEVGLSQEYDRAITALDSVDTDTIKEYLTVADKLQSHMQPAIKELLDKSEYKKHGEVNYQIGSEAIPATQYTVTITKEAVLAAAEVYLKAVYEDTSLSSYVAMLATFTGYSQNDYRNMIQEGLLDYTGLDIEVYLNDRKKLTAIVSSLDTGFCKLTWVSEGKDNWNDTITVSMESEKSIYTVKAENEGKETAYEVDFKYHSKKELYEPYAKLSMQLHKNGNTWQCKKADLEAYADNEKLEMSLTGDCYYEFLGE